MLNINYPKIEKKEFTNLELNLVEPMNKLNLRGKSRDFFTKVGKVLSIVLPAESNTSATIKNISALWLSPDEWMVYGKDLDKNLNLSLESEISKLESSEYMPAPQYARLLSIETLFNLTMEPVAYIPPPKFDPLS